MYPAQPPARKLSPPVWHTAAKATWAHPLGTDHLGRDYLSRLLYGARISLLIGFCAVLISGVIGTVMGVLAASSMALATLTGLALGVVWWRDRVAGHAPAADYPPPLSAVHNIGSMLVLTFVGAHLAAVLMRDRRSQ